MGKFKDLDIQQHNVDPAKSRRGKNARNRGNSFEREVAAKLNGRRVGWAGGPTDVSTGVYDVQCKVGGSYPERIDRWLRGVPFRYEKLRAVVLGDSPGAGTKRRALIVFDFEEFVDFFGDTETTE
jgi:hypothetical protein